MAFEVKIGSSTMSPEKAEALFKDEHDQRRPTADTPGGFSAAPSFSEMFQSFRAFKVEYISGIENRINDGKTVTPTQIENVKTLQRLSLAGEYDYRGDHYKSRLRNLETGGAGTGNRPTWKNLELRAEHAGLLEGSRERVRIEVDHTHSLA
jgi:hypothetical protein